MADVDVRHLAGHRHQIVHHVAVEELASLVILAVLVKHAADPLHDAAADLLVDELRVDYGAAILDAPVFDQLHLAGLDVDLEIGGLHAVGESERPGAGHVMPRHHKFGLEVGRQRVGAEIDDARDFIERHAFAAGVGVDHDAGADVERLRIGLQHRSGGGKHVGA